MISSATIVALTDPFAVNHGGTIRTRGFIRELEHLGIDVDVLTPERPLGDPTFNGDEPEKGRGTAFRAGIGRLKREYLPMPTMTGARDKRLASRVRGTSSDLVIYGAFSQVAYTRQSPAPFWVDFMDVYSEFGVREAAARRGFKRRSALAQVAWLRRQEARYGMEATVVTAAGHSDTVALRSAGIDAVWLPTWVSDEKLRASTVRSDARVAGFLANFEFWPNRDAYAALVEHWREPLLSAGWTILVAGRHSDALPRVDGVEVMGEVADVGDFYDRVGVALAPVRLGGGIKVKLVEAMARGVPVVATPFALDGFQPGLATAVTQWQLGAPIPRALERGEFAMPDAALLDEFSEATAGRKLRELLGRVS